MQSSALWWESHQLRREREGKVARIYLLNLRGVVRIRASSKLVCTLTHCRAALRCIFCPVGHCIFAHFPALSQAQLFTAESDEIFADAARVSIRPAGQTAAQSSCLRTVHFLWYAASCAGSSRVHLRVVVQPLMETKPWNGYIFGLPAAPPLSLVAEDFLNIHSSFQPADAWVAPRAGAGTFRVLCSLLQFCE